MRTALLVALLALSACSSVRSPALHPPSGRPSQDVARDMADCDAGSTPGVGTYAKAAGEGLLIRAISPFVGLATVFGINADSPGTHAVARDTGDARYALLALATLGVVIGRVGGRFVAYEAASKTLSEARQERFERCLMDRGYRSFPGEPVT